MKNHEERLGFSKEQISWVPQSENLKEIAKRQRNTAKEILKKDKEETSNAWECMSMLRAKRNYIMGKNPIQTTTLTRYNQAHNPRMHEHLKIIKGNTMPNQVTTKTQNPTQNFQQIHRNPKNFPKP